MKSDILTIWIYIIFTILTFTIGLAVLNSNISNQIQTLEQKLLDLENKANSLDEN